MCVSKDLSERHIWAHWVHEWLQQRGQFSSSQRPLFHVIHLLQKNELDESTKNHRRDNYYLNLNCSLCKECQTQKAAVQSRREQTKTILKDNGSDQLKIKSKLGSGRFSNCLERSNKGCPFFFTFRYQCVMNNPSFSTKPLENRITPQKNKRKKVPFLQQSQLQQIFTTKKSPF